MEQMEMALAHFKGLLEEQFRRLETLEKPKKDFSKMETVTVGGRTHFYIPNGAPERDMPPVILLAGFDPLMLGYRKEDNPFLPGEHLRGIFNLAGIVNPAILLHGRVAGKWKESKLEKVKEYILKQL